MKVHLNDTASTVVYGVSNIVPVNSTYNFTEQIRLDDHRNGDVVYHMQHNSFETLIDFYITPIVCFLGIIFNTATFVVMLKPPMNTFSPSIYLAAHSVSCALEWLLIVGINWVCLVARLNYIPQLSEESCRLWSFVITVVQNSPYWFLTGAAIDRSIGVWSSQKAQYMCTVFVSKVGVCVIVVFLTAIAVHSIWAFDRIEIQGRWYCQIDDRIYLLIRVGKFTMTALLTFLPQILLLVFGNVLLIRLCLKHNGRQVPNSSSLDMDLTHSVTVLCLAVFIFTAPGSISNIAMDINQSNGSNHLMSMIFQYVSLLGYLPVFFILFIRCSDFRESFVAFLRSNLFCSNRSSNIELRLMNEYNQVPSTSTNL